MPWYTPNKESGFITRSFYIPREFLPFVRDALTSLANVKAWKAWGDNTPQECADLFESLLHGPDNFMIGSVFPSISTLPPGCLWCEGQTVQAVDYPLLAAHIDPSYISGGVITLPDLRGRFLLGDVAPGAVGGESQHTLTIDEMPAHDHGGHTHFPLQASGEIPTQVPDMPIPDILGSRGGGQPHNNMPPYYTVRFYIVVE